MGIESLLGGFAKGFGQAKMMKMQREKDKELAALEKQQLQIQIKAQEAALLDKKRKAELEKLLMQSPKFQKIFGISPHATEAAAEPYQKTSFGKSFEGGEEKSVTDIMASMDPMMAAMLKETTGIDFLGAGRLQAQQQGVGVNKQRLQEQSGMNRWRQGMDVKNYNLKLQETHPGVEVPTEGGGAEKIFPYKYSQPGQMPGAPKLTLRTKKQTGQMPISENSLPLWIDPVTMQSPKFGTTPNQAEAQGFQRISSADKSKVNDFKAVSVLADRIEKMMMAVFPAEESFMQRIAGGAKRTLGAALQTDVNAASLKSLLDGTTAAFVRMFEKGTLTDQDIARAKKLNVSLTDDADVAWEKIKGLKEFITDLKGSFVSGLSGKPTKTKSELPQAVIKKLKEGVQTKFGNGQVWTLKDGNPVRVK